MRFYRALLYLYPRYFRDEYRRELEGAFAERTRGRAAPAVWLAALADVVPGVLAVRWDHLRQNTAAAMTQPTVFVDVRLALRQMRRTPLFASVVVAVLALGIGLNAGLLTILNQVVWRPAPGISQDPRLVRLLPLGSRAAGSPLRETRLSAGDVAALRERRDVFAQVAGWSEAAATADFGGGTDLVEAEYVTGNFFSLLGVRLALGTGVFADDDPAGAASAVIGYPLWQRYFGGADTVLGATVRILGLPFTIVGVAPENFVGVDVVESGSDLIWLPLGAQALLEPAAPGDAARQREPRFEGLARLVDGVRAGDVDERTAALAARLVQQRDWESGARLTVGAERLMGMSSLDGNTTETVFAFMLVVAFVVLITCTNVSALLLGRAVARRREIGVRLSLGATRLRLVRQLLTESLVYAVLGAATGLVLWALASRIAHLVVPEATRGIPFEVQPVTFAYAAVFAVVTMIAMGIAPALHGTRADIGDVLKSGGQHAVGRSRLQSAFVVAQLACSQPVLVVTSLVLASMSYAAGGGAAPAPADIVTMAALVVRPRPDSAADAASLARIERRLRDVPGVAAVALSMPGGAVGGLRQTNVSTGYYAARRMPLLRGRAPGASEQGLPLAVVNELAARALWPGENPIGKRIERRSPRDGSTLSFEVVGVTRPPDYELETPRPELFVPYAYGLSLGTGELAYSTRITVRTSGDARGYVPQLRSAVREVEPYAALAGIRTVAERLADRVHEARLANLGAFLVAAVALLLASLGLYAIIAYGVAQRTREIGVRLAIGAAPGRVVGEFFRHGVRLSALGLAIGLPLTIGGIRLVMSSVMGLTLRNLVAVGFIVPVLLGVAALASWLPARRAGRVDPLIALQSE